MTEKIIGLTEWFATPPGQYLLAWEQAQFDLAVADLFGYNALQLGLPELDALRSNRMPHRWLALPEVLPDAQEAHAPRVALITDAADLLGIPRTPIKVRIKMLTGFLSLCWEPSRAVAKPPQCMRRTRIPPVWGKLLGIGNLGSPARVGSVGQNPLLVEGPQYHIRRK